MGAVKASASFEKQMSSLKAVTDANGKTMAEFKKQAIDAGIKTSFSAKQAAEAQTELAKGGLSVKNIMGGGLAGALALAAAGNLDLGEAASTTANALNLFGLRGDQAGHVADGLATAANATTADVRDFGMALAAGGSVAKSAGLTFNDTTVALEALAASGIKNSDAGTSLKSALIAVLKPSKQQAEAAHELGLKFTDATGKMKSLSAISQMLRDHLGNQTAAQRTATLATIAGTDGVRTLTSLYDAGPAKLDKFRKGLEQQGTAAKVAKTQQDNLSGKLEQFKGTLETVAIVVGDKIRPTVQAVVIALTGFANGLLTGEGAGGRFRDAAVSAFTTVKGIVLDVVSKVREFVHQFQDGQGRAVALGAALAGLTVGAVAIQVITTATKTWSAAQAALNVIMDANPIGLVVVAIAALAAGIYVAYQKSETFRTIVNAAFTSVKTVVGGVFSWLKGAFNDTVTWVKVAVDKVVTEVSQWKLLFAVVAAAWKTYFGVLKTTITVAVATIALVVKAGVAVITNTWKIGMAVLGPIVSGAWSGIKTTINGALNVIKGVIKIFGGVLKGNWSQVWDGIRQTLSGAWGLIKGTLQAGLGALVSLFKAFPGRAIKALGNVSETLLNVGKDLIAGLANGIKGAAGDVLNAIKDTITDKIPKFIRDRFQTHSPSKVMTDIGRDIGAGLAIGIAAMQGAVTQSVKTGLLFPLDSAIAQLNDKKDALQKSWDAIDARAQKSALVAATHAKAVTATAAVTASHAPSVSTSGNSDVARTIIAVGQQMGASQKQMLAAIETGIVESGLKNLNYGDADSKGWRQERTSIYGEAHATNVKQSAVDFFNEAMHSGGGTAGELAANVQRPAAQYRGRYDQVAGQAQGILSSVLGGTGSGSSASKVTKAKAAVSDAVKALKEFNTTAARAAKLAKIEAQIKGLEQLKAFKDAIKGVRDRLADMASQAAAAWRTLRESEIDKTHDAAIKALGDTAQATELAALQKRDADEAEAATKAGLDKDLADAKASGDVAAITDAEDAIAAYQRKKREDDLTAWIANETTKADTAQTTAKNGLDAEEEDYKTSLTNRLSALADNLAAGTVSYSTFAANVQGTLDALHLPPGIPGFTADATEEATINSGGGPADVISGITINGKPLTRSAYESGGLLAALLSGKPGRAAGGPVAKGYPYTVGELGAETFVPDVDGHIVPNGRGRGGDLHFHGPTTIGSGKAARVLGNQLAMRLTFG